MCSTAALSSSSLRVSYALFLSVLGAAAGAKRGSSRYNTENNAIIPPNARTEPPLRGVTFSIILPFYPPQAVELQVSMSTMSRYLNIDDVDMLLLSSPCYEEAMTRAAMMCVLPPPKEQLPPLELGADGLPTFQNESLLRTLTHKRGRLDWMPEWRSGCRQSTFSWFPRRKITHLCDDAVMCGKVRGCLLSQSKHYSNGRMPLGWYIQQLVKLGLSRFVTSPHMLILDADVYAVNSISAATLLNTFNGTPKVVTSRKVFKGTPIASKSVGGRWTERYAIALDLLGANLSEIVPETTHILGVTPEVLSTTLTRRILDRLEALHKRPWYNTLAYSRFTEYAMYNTFLMIQWESVGRGLHDIDLAKRKRQLSIWAHDLDPIEKPNPGLPFETDKPTKFRYAENVLKSKMILFQHAALGSFFICQDESGLTPDDCAALADSAADTLRKDPGLKNIH